MLARQARKERAKAAATEPEYQRWKKKRLVVRAFLLGLVPLNQAIAAVLRK